MQDYDLMHLSCSCPARQWSIRITLHS